MVRITAFVLVFAALPIAAFAQSASAPAADVAARTAGPFEAIDPDREMTAEPEDPSSALSDGAAETASSAPADGDAPRGPAVRMIARPVVQPLAAPVPPAASAPVEIAGTNPFVIKSILPIEGSIRYGDWFWDESAAPATGKMVITIDLEARVISAFRDGHEIGTAVVLLGTQEHPTPLGTFPILTKERDNVSEKYNNAPMPWTLRLTWDGIAIHGSPVMNGYASHGCIGVPDDFAAKLFAATKRGDKVVITRGKLVNVGDKLL